MAALVSGEGRGEELMVFAAASLANVMVEVAELYEREHGDGIAFSFDASSTLARQIIAGAPVDVFISADEAKMDWLEERGLLLAASRQRLLSNGLVVVAHRDSRVEINQLDDLVQASITRVAMADPAAVPAGIYAKTWLQSAALWEQVESRMIPLQNVRAALAAVESGNADIGWVYRTDAAANQRTRVIFEVPAAETPNISYPVAILGNTRSLMAAQRFLDVLRSDEARALFERYGFGVHTESRSIVP
jgi:molybdate transport system substrate-binding protein